MARGDNPLEELLERFGAAAQATLLEFVDELVSPHYRAPQQARARHTKVKPPKTAKTPKPAKRERYPYPQPTHYDTLQISKTADTEIVTAAWKAACRKHHPDTGHGNAKKMAEINAAYEVLKDPIKRREYDRGIR